LVKAANKITGNSELSYDLLHYAIEELSFKANVQSIIDSGGARFYLVRIMMTQWRSKTGPFYKQYIKIYNKNLTILPEYIDHFVNVYNGKNFVNLTYS
jgi:hypothetical protein